MLVPKGLLQAVELAFAGESLDGRHLLPVGLHREHQAGACGAALDEHGARAAHAVLAADVRAGEAELVAQEIGERQARLHGALVALAIDRDAELAQVLHCASACSSARRASVT